MLGHVSGLGPHEAVLQNVVRAMRGQHVPFADAGPKLRLQQLAYLAHLPPLWYQ